MDALRTLRARALALPVWARDAALAAIVVVGGAAELLAGGVGARAASVGAGSMVVIAGALVLRRRLPIFAMTAGFLALGGAQQDPELVETTIPFLGLFLLPFSMARWSDDRRFPYGLALLLVLAATVFYVTPGNEDRVQDVVFALTLVVGAPVVAGRLLRSRAALAAALERKASRLAAERGRAAEQAVLEERERIAGELHDVVAHALSAMVVGAGAARRLAAGNPGTAAEAFGSVEVTGREALTELRRLLGVLRRDDEELALAPQPSLAHVADLARRARRGGLPVELAIVGEQPAALPPGVDLTAYRVVQAALTAAREPGGAASASVVVRYEPAAVEVAVTDDGGGRRGRALLGMRERVSLYGGELRAAALLSGGHAVRARLPLTAVDA